MKKRLLLLMVLLTVSGGFFIFGQAGRAELTSFEFIDQPIRDILYAFSTYAGIPIIADDTVSGAASFQFNGTDFEQAFNSFLLSSRLYVEKQADLWIVSRIKLSVDRNTFILDAYDATPAQLFEKLARYTGATIIQDILPAAKISLHLSTASVYESAQLIMKPFADYTVEQADGYIQVKRIPAAPLTAGPQASVGMVNIWERDGSYEVEIERARLGDVMESLFLTARREYVSFLRSDIIVERAKFSGKTLEEALLLILRQANGEYKVVENVYYVLPLQQADIIEALKNTDKSWRYFHTKYIIVQEVIPLLQGRFPGLQSISLGDQTSFVVLADDILMADIQSYLEYIDSPRHAEPVKLKYIRTEDLFKSLPPSVKREDLVDTGSGNEFFFVGTPERRDLFLKDLLVIDRPQIRIRYDVFIIQVQDTVGFNWGFEAVLRQLQPGDTTMVTGEIGRLLNINFDIITLFGYQFALRMNTALAENEASILADTTLMGLSGEEIKFQNTSTYRYRDSNMDPETGRPIYSGVTREIISGLMLEIKGWVSGDGMITTSVTATVSKRGADVSSDIGNPPPTFEKILTTQVRGRSGETVVLSGLRQNDTTIVEERVPFISRVPLLGWFFKNRESTQEKSQMIIYLVPHVDISNDEYTVEGLKTASIYDRFVAPFLED